MPNRTLLICAGLGLLVIGAIVGGGLFASRGAHLELEGKIAKTRTAALSPSCAGVTVSRIRVTLGIAISETSTSTGSRCTNRNGVRGNTLRNSGS